VDKPVLRADPSPAAGPVAEVGMKIVQQTFRLGYGAVAVLFLCSGLALIVLAGAQLWQGIAPGVEQSLRDRFDALLEAIGLLTIAVAALELGQTVLEEEVLRSAHISAPTRVRRFLSRFMIVVVVSLSIECLVAVFQLADQAPELVPQAAMIGVAAAALLASWGLFIRLNKSVEELEPEAMEAAKEEDAKVEAEPGPTD
jgi:hypothetical protein